MKTNEENRIQSKMLLREEKRGREWLDNDNDNYLSCIHKNRLINLPLIKIDNNNNQKKNASISPSSIQALDFFGI